MVHEPPDLPTRRPARAPVELRAPGDARTESDALDLFRRRLTLFDGILMAGAGIFLVRALIISESFIWQRAIGMAVFGGAFVWLRSGKTLSRNVLFLVEAVLLLVMAAQMSVNQCLKILGAAADGDRALVIAGRHFLASSAFALIVIYGLIVPNRWSRAAVVTSILVVLTYILPMAYVGADEAVRELAPDFISMSSCVDAIAYLGLGVLIAVAGTHMLRSMRTEVRDARRLGQYELVKKIGAGGMGDVWRARHAYLARPAAVKLIQMDALSDGAVSPEKALARFEHEAQATASLTSPHTVTVYDYGVTDDRSVYYAMELLQGVDLQKLVEKHGPLEPARAVWFAVQACRSLAEAHEAGLMHRDVKPANLFCARLGGEEDVLKVLDFGLVKRVDADSKDVNATRGAIGTPAFMAPESVKSGELTHSIDIYAMGCVLYWMLTGLYVFDKRQAMEMAVAHATERPIPPSQRTTIAIPETLEAIVLDCLAKDPADRPDSARELQRRLETVELNGAPWSHERATAWWSARR